MEISFPFGWTRGEVAVAGGSLVYHRTNGGGRPLVLAHGLSDNGLCWARIAEALAEDYDVIMLDARGHGESLRPGPEGLSQEIPGQDIGAVISSLGLTGVAVMGHSMGARAAASCAAAIPDRIRAVILEDPPLLPPMEPEEAVRRLTQFHGQVAQLKAMSEDELLALARRQSPPWDPAEFAAWIVSKHQVDPGALPIPLRPWQEDIARVRAPVLILHGDTALGSMVSAQAALEARRLNPNLRALRISGAGHNVRRERFSEFLFAVRSFLAEA